MRNCPKCGDTRCVIPDSAGCLGHQVDRLTAALARERRVSARLAQMCAVDWCQPGPCPVDKDGESLDCAACVMLQAEAEADKADNAATKLSTSAAGQEPDDGDCIGFRGPGTGYYQDGNDMS